MELPSTLTPTIAGLSRDYIPNVIVNNYGDNYKQRAPNGINNIDRRLVAEFVGDASDISVYIDFFKGLKGAYPFTWTLPKESVSTEWVCTKWTITNNSDGIETLSATIERY